MGDNAAMVQVARRTLGVPVVGLLLTAVLAGQNPRYENPSLHYSFDLPANWEQIPQEVLQYTFAEVARATGMPEVRYETGFQRDAETWLAYPYLLVQHHQAGSATFNEIARSLGSATPGVAERLKGQEILSDLRFEQPTTDPDRQLVLLPLSLNVMGVGPVRGLSVMKPGRNGLVQVTMYARASDYDEHAGDFEAVVKSLAFAPGYEYSATAAIVRTFDWSKILRGTVVGALVGALIGLIAYARRRIR